MKPKVVCSSFNLRLQHSLGHSLKLLLILSIIFPVFPAGFAAAAEADSGQAAGRESTDNAADSERTAVAALEALLAQTSSMSADVEQLLIDQDGRELQELKAHLQMVKPERFSWQVTAPYEELMVTNGTTIWRYEADLEQVTIQEFNDDLDRTPLMILNGDAEAIAAAYAVSAVFQSAANVAELAGSSGEAPEAQTISRFILLPSQPGNLFERLSLTFRGADLQEMQFEDSRGQQTSLSFSKVVRNADIPARQFSFEPPAGIDIIDTTQD